MTDRNVIVTVGPVMTNVVDVIGVPAVAAAWTTFGAYHDRLPELSLERVDCEVATAAGHVTA